MDIPHFLLMHFPAPNYIKDLELPSLATRICVYIYICIYIYRVLCSISVPTCQIFHVVHFSLWSLPSNSFGNGPAEMSVSHTVSRVCLLECTNTVVNCLSIYTDTSDMCIYIWGFPKIGVPLNHSFLDGMFHSKPSILGYPIYGNPHIYIILCVSSNETHGFCLFSVGPAARFASTSGKLGHQ